MDPTPLPPQLFPESASQIAYQRCLALQDAAQAGLNPNPGCPPPLVCARLLGHLLRLAPNSNARAHLQREIASTENDVELMEVAKVYFNGFIRAFKRSGGPTPAPSEHPSRLSFEDARAYTMQQGNLDHRKARDAALLRTDYCCMVTGRRSIRHGGIEYVHAAHIIPEIVNTNIDEGDKNRFHSVGVWPILSVFADIDIVPQLAGNNIHRLENIVLMYQFAHNLFDDLRMWFKPVAGRPHAYRIHLAREELRKYHPIPETVTFSTKTDLPLPNGTYLALHALCCEVAWMSGAAEHITDIEKRMDGTDALANDGSTADLLANSESPTDSGLFLTARQTAMVDEALFDEVIHVVAGMSFTGHRGVTSMMWSIADRVAPHTTRDRYERLLQNGEIADALGRLRESNASSLEWLPFIHVGL